MVGKNGIWLPIVLIINSYPLIKYYYIIIYDHYQGLLIINNI
jgi:hypothetical protein